MSRKSGNGLRPFEFSIAIIVKCIRFVFEFTLKKYFCRRLGFAGCKALDSLHETSPKLNFDWVTAPVFADVPLFAFDWGGWFPFDRLPLVVSPWYSSWDLFFVLVAAWFMFKFCISRNDLLLACAALDSDGPFDKSPFSSIKWKSVSIVCSWNTLIEDVIFKVEPTAIYCFNSIASNSPALIISLGSVLMPSTT